NISYERRPFDTGDCQTRRAAESERLNGRCDEDVTARTTWTSRRKVSRSLGSSGRQVWTTASRRGFVQSVVTHQFTTGRRVEVAVVNGRGVSHLTFGQRAQWR